MWQYITLMKRIFLIDCPGIVPPSAKDSETDILFRGVVRVEHVSNPEQFIPAMLERCKTQHLERTYEISGWKTPGEFLELIARKHGRLLKGGEPDETGVAKLVLNDFNRGKIPWFVPPPFENDVEDNEEGIAGRAGRLGEMRKRKVEEEKDETPEVAKKTKKSSDDKKDEEDEEWKGIED